MSNVLIETPAIARVELQAPTAIPRDQVVALTQLLSRYRSVLCAVVPDDTGRRILQRVATVLRARSCRMGIVCASSFELPFDALACMHPTPYDRRARLIVDRQRQLDQLARELGMREAELFATAGDPAADIRALTGLWKPDLVLFARSAGTGLRSRIAHGKGPDFVALDDRGSIAPATFIERLFGGGPGRGDIDDNLQKNR